MMLASANGIDIAYDDEGQGMVVLLLHGFPLNRSIWAPQVAALRDEFRVITPDLRGHGQSQVTAGVYAMELLADDVHALLDELGVRSVVLGGHSMGGYVALAFARRYPERLRGLVLVNTRAGADSAQGKANREASIAQAQTAGAAALADDMLPKLLAPRTLSERPDLAAAVHGMMAATDPLALAGAQRGMAVRPDATDVLESLFLPVLVIAGLADQVVPLDEAQAMADTVPGARLVEIGGAGHMTMLEAPEVFNAALLEFLQKQVA